MESPGDHSDSPVACPRCGAQASDTDAFCGECGAPIDRVASTSAVVPASPAEMTPPAMSPPAESAPQVAPEIVTAPTGNGMPPTGGDEALRGAAVGNEVYHGQRLAYQSNQQGVEDFNPMSLEFTKVMLFRFFAVVAATIWLGPILLIPVFFIVAQVGGEGAAKAVLYFYAIGGFVLWMIFFFRPIPIALAEWKFLVDDKAAAARSAFEHITWAFRRRRSPVASLRVRRLSQVAQESRDYLQVRDGVFSGYVSCFAYGGDLYIAWNFWWNLSPFRWFLIALGRLWQTLTFRGSQIHILARYENGKALREALHGATREGIDVAAGNITAQGAGTIGSEIPVELVSAPAEMPGFLERAEIGQPSA